VAFQDPRLTSLYRYNILDTPAEAGFDGIVRVAATVCETPVSLVSFVSFDRQWFKARTGFAACQTSLEESVCAHVVAERRLLVIPDLTADPRTQSNPLVIGPPNIRFYAGAPLMTPQQEVLGALCVIDSKPRPSGLSPAQADALTVLAGQVMTQLELRRINADKARDLLAALGATELREKFIAVLGHDLRNPLSAISSGVQMLQDRPRGQNADRILAMMAHSVTRMSGLVDNVLDFARGRLGGAFDINRTPTDLRPVLEHVVAEMQASWPERVIQTSFAIDHAVDCDGPRVAQLFSNLLGNALVHGLEGGAVKVRAWDGPEGFELDVSNRSEEIPRETLQRLFQPFVRGEEASDGRGLGLGLYIASEIAHAHGGELSARWSEGRASFRFTIPRRADAKTPFAGEPHDLAACLI
jgi:signal transduction histidine kinase